MSNTNPVTMLSNIISATTARIIQKNSCFVCVKIENAQNAGAIARAMKNYGFNNLVFVAPRVNFLSDEAIAMAHGAQDILENAMVFEDIEKAVSDKDFIIGTSQRRRKNSRPYYGVNSIVQKLEDTRSVKKVAIIFGPESRGLTNDELNRCNFICTIPSVISQPSLNLSQAALIMAYELSGLKMARGDYQWDLANQDKIQILRTEIVKMLEMKHFPAAGTIENFSDLLFRSFLRSNPENRDIAAWLKMIKFLQKDIE